MFQSSGTEAEPSWMTRSRDWLQELDPGIDHIGCCLHLLCAKMVVAIDQIRIWEEILEIDKGGCELETQEDDWVHNHTLASPSHIIYNLKMMDAHQELVPFHLKQRDAGPLAKGWEAEGAARVPSAALVWPGMALIMSRTYILSTAQATTLELRALKGDCYFIFCLLNLKYNTLSMKHWWTTMHGMGMLGSCPCDMVQGHKMVWISYQIFVCTVGQQGLHTLGKDTF